MAKLIIDKGAGLEDNDNLIEKWSGLLASAASGGKVLPSFAHILSELSPSEAKILDYIYTHRKKLEFVGDSGVDKQDLEKAMGLSIEEYGIRILNLRRLGMIEQVTTDAMRWQAGHGGWGAGGDVGLTALGESFIDACKGLPKTAVV